MKSVNKAVRKKDAMELLLGKPVYTEDIAPKDCLVVKLLRSPYANAFVKNINTDIAMKVPGIEAIFTYKDVDQNMKRFTCAGQTYPEPSPYDRLILDKHVRFIGDPVAIVAGADERCVDKAMKLIKTEYEVLEPLLDFTKARIMRFLYTLRITGRHYVRLELIIKGIFVHMMRAATEISIRCWTSVIL